MYKLSRKCKNSWNINQDINLHTARLNEDDSLAYRKPYSVRYNVIPSSLPLHPLPILHHRLNGSSSPVLTATSLSYGKAKNSTPTESNPWSDWDKIWHGWLRRRVDPSCKISCKSLQGGFPANGWNIRQNFYSYPYTFFYSTHLQVRPFGGFLRAMAQTTRSCARMCLLGVKKIEINI